MGASSIVLEQRLRTANPAIVLGLVVALVAKLIVVVVDSSHGRSIPGFALGVIVSRLRAHRVLVLHLVSGDVRVVQESKGRSLAIRYGPGGLIRQRFAGEEILAATCEPLSPLKSGGGYRGSLRFFKRAALVTRHGDPSFSR